MYYQDLEPLMESIEAIQPKLRESSDVTAEEFGEFLEYKVSLGARQRLYKRFTDENGNFTMFEEGNKRDKEALNELSQEIHHYEKKFKDTLIFEMLERELRTRLPNPPARDSKGRFIEVVAGWYQNSSGDLFHYDGVVWDKVPSERLESLEYLG
jgi:hypothetical protein